MSNVAIFVPHRGCRHRCSFCDQRTISGEGRRVGAQEVRQTLLKAMENEHHRENQIAFFGGSFTAIEPAYRKELLEATVPFREQFGGIRISTRPDAIDREILRELKQYDVRAIELGAQSMNDEVLKLNRRGHTAQDVVRASEMIRAAGFELGLQMMTGLFGDTEQKALESARQMIALQPATVRIYPTAVLEGTELAELYRRGVYQPPDTQQSIALCAQLIEMFEDAGIRILRVGLHASDALEKRCIAGAYHPAFKEKCLARLYLEQARKALRGRQSGAYTLAVGTAFVSQMVGQNRENLKQLEQEGYFVKVTASAALPARQVKVMTND